MNAQIVTFQQPRINQNLDQALAHAARGWYVFPCKPDKTPHTRHGLKDASTNPDQVRAWWAKWPDALIGVACQRSGFFAVDLDRKPGKPDGVAAWGELVESYGGGQPITAGPVQSTPSSGYHVLFRLPEGLDVPNNAGQLAPGIDLRSNGYICTGGAYAWQVAPDSVIPDPPAWLVELIRNLRPAPKPGQPRQAAPGELPPAEDAGAYWLAHFLRQAAPGTRNHTGFSLAQQLRDSGLTQAAADSVMREYAARVPGDGYTEGEALASLRSAYIAPAREPATLPGMGARRNGHHPPPAVFEDPRPIEDLAGLPPPPEPPEELAAGGVYAATLAQLAEDAPPPELRTWADMAGVLGPIRWAWKPWLPAGMLTILAGESGAGKSALVLRLAACFLRGDPWPDGTPFTGELGGVLWCEAEAAQAINLERAKAWRLPLDHLYSPLDNPLEDLRLDRGDHFAALVRRAMMPEVSLIVVDSLRGANSRSENDSDKTMEVVKLLATLARDSGKLIILTHHLRKRGILDSDSPDLERLRGSSAIVQTARLVWALDVPDPGNKAWKRLQVIKNNLAAFPEPIGLTIDGNGLTFGTAPSIPKTETVMDRAIDLLLALLGSDPQPAEVIESEFNQAGISLPTMKRAKARLGIVSVKDHDGWKWSLPAKSNPAPFGSMELDD